MPDKRWKAQERRIAHLLGLERVGPTGRATPDLVGEHLVVEVKDRADLPQWLREALIQVVDQARFSQLAVVVLTSPTLGWDLVLMELRDFRELLRKAGM